jgi:hypothetical protein
MLNTTYIVKDKILTYQGTTYTMNFVNIIDDKAVVSISPHNEVVHNAIAQHILEFKHLSFQSIQKILDKG